MDRKKPALTSPGKVGFLVALLLVVTALGVSYLITGTFGVTWHWIHVGGLSPATWTFNLGAFLEEMAPLLLLTALLAFGASVLVSGAVRRYKAYVDSGVEYKQLLKSIKNVEDLENEDVTDKLKQHPELREFMMGVKHRVAAMERQHEEKSRKPAHSSPQNRGEERPALGAECEALASTIADGPDALSRGVTVTTPELKQIERALRAMIANLPQPQAAGASSAPMLEELRSSVRGTIAAMRRDVAACGIGAQEVETALGGLRSDIEGAAGKPAAGNTTALQKRVDATADALVTLGEDTKRIAIGAALQASGGPEGDNIKVADELRTLATRFNSLAVHWRETLPALKQALGSTGASDPASSTHAAAIATAMNRARLWSERTVAMNEHVHSLERAIGLDAVEDTRATASPVESPRVESGTIDLEIAPIAPRRPTAEDQPESFVPQTAADVFANDDSEDAAFADIPGFEKERKFFAAAPATNADERFVVDGGQDRRWDLANDAAEEEAADPVESRAKAPAADADGFLTGPRPTVKPKRATPAPAPAPRAPVVPMADLMAKHESATATIDPDADAMDLYALGAVDCVQNG